MVEYHIWCRYINEQKIEEIKYVEESHEQPILADGDAGGTWRIADTIWDTNG